MTGNTDTDREFETWKPVLDAEIERVDPAVIVTLGNVATHALLDTDEGISEIHGERRDKMTQHNSDIPSRSDILR